MRKAYSVLFCFISFLAVGCRTQKSPLDRRDKPDPITATDLQNAKEFACVDKNELWEPEFSACMTPVVACEKKGGVFYEKKCLSLEEHCHLLKSTHEWWKGKCILKEEVCQKKKESGYIWTGVSCLTSMEACLNQGPQWDWNSSEKFCFIKSFKELCLLDESLPLDFQKTIHFLRNLKNGKTMTCEDSSSYMVTLTELNLLDEDQDQVSNLYPISHWLSLKKITIKKRSSSLDLTPLSTLKNLEYMDINGLSVKNLFDFSVLEKLKYLDISDNKVEDLEPIRGAKSIIDLNVSNNPISSLYFLKDLKNLKTLDASATTIEKDIPKTPTNCPQGPYVAAVLDQFCTLLNPY
jgi:hypothetical protein